MDTAEEIRAQVRAGWAEEAAGWIKHHDLMTRWTSAATALVVEAARPRPGHRALDVASGTGRVAFALAPRVAPGTVACTDLVPDMVRGAAAIGRRDSVANLAYQAADAESLPFADARFDLVTCLHGAMFFPDAARAAREMRRVLRPCGRAVLLVWGPPERNPFLGTLAGPFLSRLPPGPADGEDEPGPFRFAAPGRLAGILRSAGFSRVEERLEEIPWSFPGRAPALFAAANEISSSLYGWLRSALSAADYAEAAREVQAALAERDDGERVAFHATMVLVTGERPPDGA